MRLIDSSFAAVHEPHEQFHFTAAHTIQHNDRSLFDRHILQGAFEVETARGENESVQVEQSAVARHHHITQQSGAQQLAQETAPVATVLVPLQ